MPLPFAAMAAAGGSLIETGITSAFNAWQASKNRQFQRFMSDTAHQREVKDLAAAGLNPILSARLGGASTPPGSSAQASVSNASQRAIEALRIQGDLALQKAQAMDLTAAAQLKDSQRGEITTLQTERLTNLQALTKQMLSQSGLSDAQRAQLQTQEALLKAQIKKIEVETASSAFDQNKKKLASRGFEAANKVLDAAGNVVKDVKKQGGIKGLIQENIRRFRRAIRGNPGASGSF